MERIISFSVTLFFPYDHIHWKRDDATISSCIILPAAYPDSDKLQGIISVPLN